MGQEQEDKHSHQQLKESESSHPPSDQWELEFEGPESQTGLKS